MVLFLLDTSIVHHASSMLCFKQDMTPAKSPKALYFNIDNTEIADRLRLRI